MNQQKHWNKISTTYNDEIFDVFNSDRNNILTRYFDKYANPEHHAIDFGCGIGKAFSYLSPRFKSVLATDISDECLAMARTKPYSNIEFKQADLANPTATFPKANFAFCCNVIMLPEVELNYQMFTNIRKALRPDGHAILVVPSMESALFSSWQMIQWCLTEGTAPGDIPKDELNYFNRSKTDIIQGLVNIEGVTTKHYTREELAVIIPKAGLEIVSLEKIEYEWTSEFNDPPRWMKAPFPWDWLVECGRP